MVRGCQGEGRATPWRRPIIKKFELFSMNKIWRVDDCEVINFKCKDSNSLSRSCIGEEGT